MPSTAPQSPFHAKLIDGLYVDAMALAEAARGYYDGIGRDDRDELDPLVRVAFSCESLKVTTRLMHVIAWVLTQRAVEAGEMDWAEARQPIRRLGASPDTDDMQLAALPEPARRLTQASLDLHRRVERLDAMADEGASAASPVQVLQARLSRAF
jgi:regulator of CtrA degradation